MQQILRLVIFPFILVLVVRFECTTSLSPKVSVRCSLNAMEMFVDFDEPFFGRLKARSADDCLVAGKGRKKLGFRLPLDESHRRKCSITKKGDEYLAMVVLEWNSKVITGDDNVYLIKCPQSIEESNSKLRQNDLKTVDIEASDLQISDEDEQNSTPALSTGTKDGSRMTSSLIANHPFTLLNAPNVTDTPFLEATRDLFAESDEKGSTALYSGEYSKYVARKCLAFLDGNEENSKEDNPRGQMEVVYLTDESGCPMNVLKNNERLDGELIRIKRNSNTFGNKKNTEILEGSGWTLELKFPHYPFPNASYFHLQCEIRSCRESGCKKPKKDRCQSKFSNAIHSDNPPESSIISSVRVFNDESSDPMAEDIDNDSKPSSTNCSTDKKELFELITMLFILLAVCSVVIMLIIVARERVKSTIQNIISRSRAEQSTHQQITNKRDVFSRFQHFKLEDKSAKNVGHSEKMIQNSAKTDMLNFDASNRNGCCANGNNPSMSIAPQQSLWLNKLQRTILPPKFDLLEARAKFPLQRSLSKSGIQIYSSLDGIDDESQQNSKVIPSSTNLSNSSTIQANSPTLSSPTTTFSLDRLPEPPSISLREINELNAAFNSSFLNSSNQGRSDSKVLNLGTIQSGSARNQNCQTKTPKLMDHSNISQTAHFSCKENHNRNGVDGIREKSILNSPLQQSCAIQNPEQQWRHSMENSSNQTSQHSNKNVCTMKSAKTKADKFQDIAYNKTNTYSVLNKAKLTSRRWENSGQSPAISDLKVSTFVKPITAQKPAALPREHKDFGIRRAELEQALCKIRKMKEVIK